MFRFCIEKYEFFPELSTFCAVVVTVALDGFLNFCFRWRLFRYHSKFTHQVTSSLSKSHCLSNKNTLKALRGSKTKIS